MQKYKIKVKFNCKNLIKKIYGRKMTKQMK